MNCKNGDHAIVIVRRTEEEGIVANTWLCGVCSAEGVEYYQPWEGDMIIYSSTVVL